MKPAQQILTLLQEVPPPGLQQSVIASRVGITAEGMAYHLKRIRRQWVVKVTADALEGRVKHYRVTGRRKDASAQDQPTKKAAKPAPQPALSAMEVEALICTTIDKQHNKPMLISALKAATGLPATMVRPALIAMVQRQTLVNSCNGYRRPEARPLINREHVATPRQVDVMAGTYTGA